MKVVAFNSSPRKDGNTAILINQVLAELEKEGIETELVQLGGKPVRGCTACRKCVENKNKKCAITTDIINSCLEKMLNADGIILGSPTYVANVSTEMKALIDRATVVGRANDQMFKRKVGAAVIAVRRAGAVNVFSAINFMFFANQMVVPGSSYWNLGLGGAIGEVENDQEGQQTMVNLGQNMAWLIKQIGA
jgi:multimeric flavodoxin WrbA